MRAAEFKGGQTFAKFVPENRKQPLIGLEKKKKTLSTYQMQKGKGRSKVNTKIQKFQINWGWSPQSVISYHIY